MESLNDSLNILIWGFIVVFKKFNQIAIFEIATDPIFLFCVLQNPISFKNSIFKFSDIKIAVFKYFFPHSTELCIHVVPSFNNFQLKIILLAMRIGVVASLRTSKDELQSQSIDKSIFFETYYHFVSMLFRLNIRHFLEIIANHFSMSSAYENLILSTIKNSVK